MSFRPKIIQIYGLTNAQSSNIPLLWHLYPQQLVWSTCLLVSYQQLVWSTCLLVSYQRNITINYIPINVLLKIQSVPSSVIQTSGSHFPYYHSLFFPESVSCLSDVLTLIICRKYVKLSDWSHWSGIPMYNVNLFVRHSK